MKVKLDPGCYLPERAHELDAGYDLRSPITAVIPPYSSAVINTGVHIEIPAQHVGMLKSKSGLNVKHDLTSEGVVDAGYTGSIQVKLYNHGQHTYTVHKGDKVSQLVVMPIITPALELVEALDETERGENGFGSSGR